jgi:hypothetical protein
MNTDLHRCIWCGMLSESTLEHILPDSLGCPPQFVLEKGVCKKCNNGLADLDGALLKQFEIVAFMAGVPKKGGRPPSIDTWAGIAARVGASGPEMHINAGPQSIEAFGRKLNPISPAKGLSDHKFTADSGVGKVSFSQTFGDDPKFVRAIYKVAFSSFTFYQGIQAANNPLHDDVRAFVKHGKGSFRS